MTSVKLIFNGTTYTIPCVKVQVEGRRLTTAKPNANPIAIVEVQTQGMENPLYTIQGLHFTGSAKAGESVLTQQVLLNILKSNNTGTGHLKLEVQYGTSSYLYGSDGTTTQIPVVMKAYSMPLDTKASKNSYMPVGTISLVETL